MNVHASPSEPVRTGGSSQESGFRGARSGRPERKREKALLFLLPAPVFLAAISVIYSIHGNIVFTTGLLLPVLNFIFLTCISLLVAFFAARTFLMHKSPAARRLGAGMIVFGVVSFLGGIAVPGGQYDTGITIFNTGMLLSSIFNLLAVLELILPSPAKNRRKPQYGLLGWYGTAFFLAIAAYALELSGIIPGFFVEGSGPTPIRQYVLGSSILLFSISAFLLFFLSTRRNRQFFLLYATGLSLFAIGLSTVLGITSANSLLAWMGRSSQYAGAIYLLFATLKSTIGSGQFILPLTTLEETYSRHTSLVESSPDAVIVYDGELFLFVNPAAVKLYGVSDITDLVGKPVRAWIHRDSLETVVNHIGDVLSGKSSDEPIESKLVRRDGNILTVQSIDVLVEYEGKSAIQAILRDITERKFFEQELLFERDRAEAANQAKTMFLATMSHELRTPIGGIIGLCDMLLSRAPDDANAGYLSMIRNATTGLLGVIGDILDLSLIESGKIEVKPVVFNLREKLHHLVELYRIPAETKGLRLSLNIDRETPSWVRADMEKIFQILKNFLSNALKYTDSGEIICRVACSGPDGRKRECLFTVEDTGPGIPRELQAKLFEKYSRLSGYAVDREKEGTGLGLVISKRLADLLDGKIGVESESEKGCRFSFSVPLEESDPSRESDRIKQENPVSLLSTIHPLNVLIAEDEAVNRTYLEVIFREAGHSVTIAGTGEEAVEKAAGEPFDIVLMDVQMPVMDGMTASGKIRELPDERRTVPIIALTAYAMAGDRERFLAAGMNGYVTKPVDFVKLSTELKKLVV